MCVSNLMRKTLLSSNNAIRSMLKSNLHEMVQKYFYVYAYFKFKI